MGWLEYYRDVYPISLGDQHFAYNEVISQIALSSPQFLEINNPLTFVLGGFHPYTDTPETFLKLCQNLHPNPKDHHIFMDMNKEPLASRKYPNRVQAQLEYLPFKNIDVLFLDSTLLFMKQYQIAKFMQSATQSLSCDGLIIATLRQPVFPKLSRFRDSWINRQSVYFHSNQTLTKLARDLKIIYSGQYDVSMGFTHPLFSIWALARPDSTLSTLTS